MIQELRCEFVGKGRFLVELVTNRFTNTSDFSFEVEIILSSFIMREKRVSHKFSGTFLTRDHQDLLSLGLERVFSVTNV